jgi:hypothetical protein
MKERRAISATKDAAVKKVPGVEMPSAPTKPTSAAPKPEIGAPTFTSPQGSTTPGDPEQFSPRFRAEIGKLSPPLQAGMADIVRRKQGQP